MRLIFAVVLLVACAGCQQGSMGSKYYGSGHGDPYYWDHPSHRDHRYDQGYRYNPVR